MPTTYGPNSDVLDGEWRAGAGGVATHVAPPVAPPKACSCGTLLRHAHTKQCRACWLLAQRASLGSCCEACGCLLKHKDEVCPNCQVPKSIAPFWLARVYARIHEGMAA